MLQALDEVFDLLLLDGRQITKLYAEAVLRAVMNHFAVQRQRVFRAHEQQAQAVSGANATTLRISAAKTGKNTCAPCRLPVPITPSFVPSNGTVSAGGTA